jgi:hypothetical protein
MDNWTVQLVLCIVQTVSYGIQRYSFVSDVTAVFFSCEHTYSGSPLNCA